MLTTGEARRVKCGWLCYFEACAMTDEGFHFLIEVAPRLPLLGFKAESDMVTRREGEQTVTIGRNERNEAKY